MSDQVLINEFGIFHKVFDSEIHCATIATTNAGRIEEVSSQIHIHLSLFSFNWKRDDLQMKLLSVQETSPNFYTIKYHLKIYKGDA